MAEPTRTVAFEGAQTVANAEDACARLRDALAQGGGLAIDLTRVTEADLAFVQLLVAARRRAGELGCGLVIRADAGGAVASALVRGGLAAAKVLEELPPKGDLR